MTEWLILAVVAILAVLWYVFQSSKEIKSNPSPPKEVVKCDLRYDQLRKYDGIQDKKTYLALKGQIFDVTGSPFYEPGSGYHAFTGHDASINLAKMSHDEQYLNKHGEITLDEEENKVLEDWKARFDSKYPKIGVVLK